MRLATYNPMSVVSPGRLQEISSELSLAQVIGLQGLRLRAQPHSDVSASLQEQLFRRVALRISYCATSGAAIERLSDSIRTLTSDIRKLRHRLHTQYVRRLEAELWECWHARQLHQAWVLARRIAGTSVGPGRRHFNVPLRARPSALEWDEFLSRPSCEGGLASTSVTLAGIIASRQLLRTAPQLEHVEAAAQDYHHITILAVHSLAFRNSSPPPQVGGGSAYALFFILLF